MNKYFQLIRNMGMRYILFRLFYEIKRKSGILRRAYPVSLEKVGYPTLKDWQSDQMNFFPMPNSGELNSNGKLQANADQIKDGYLKFFSRQWIYSFDSDRCFDWFKNPTTNYTYSTSQHWTQVASLSKDAGDIKYVWEKSRFSWFYYIIRNDASLNQDSSQFVFRHICDWIDKNRLNCGPNYKCSQEISIRVLNWVFALYFYKKSEALTNAIFQKVLHSIRGQIKHVYSNINFSRITVRNNHAITECLTLYLTGLLFPFFPESNVWKRDGRKWFEKEIEYQIYDNGAYLQFSMNYHRVVVQLLTWGIRLSELNGEYFSSIVYRKTEKTLQFLYDFTDPNNGKLPNYGANDGALFFPLNNDDYRDYRGALTGLASVLGKNKEFPFKDYRSEDALWYMGQVTENIPRVDLNKSVLSNRDGFYTYREDDSFTFLRCGAYKDRPSQSDNLHLDLWYQGENVLLDGGSFKYNTEDEDLRYFNGNRGHNIAYLGENDQMLKGARFIWYNWVKQAICNVNTDFGKVTFDAMISPYTYLKSGIVQKRKVTKLKGVSRWIVEDSFTETLDEALVQVWRINPRFKDRLRITACSEDGETLKGKWSEGWQADYYGEKYRIPVLEFQTSSPKIITKITVN